MNYMRHVSYSITNKASKCLQNEWIIRTYKFKKQGVEILRILPAEMQARDSLIE